MNISFKSFARATTVAALIAVSAPAFADSAQLTQIEDEIAAKTTELGMSPIEMGNLSFTQIADIFAELEGSDNSNAMQTAIEEIVNRPARTTSLARSSGTVPSSAQLRDGVVASAGRVGVTLSNPDMLTFGQLAEMEDTLISSDMNAVAKRDALNAILTTSSHDAAMTMHVADVPKDGELERTIVADLEGLGIQVSDPGAMTVQQLTELASIMSTDDNDASKSEAARKVLLQ